MEELTEISLRERIRLNLVFAMEKAKISQVNLADKLGISKGTVNNWVRGNNSPDVDMVPKICKVLNITIRDFYSDNSTANHESQDERNIKNAPPYSSEAMQLAQDYDEKLDTWGRKQVRDVADNEILRCKAEKKKQEADWQARAAAVQEQKSQMEATEEIAPEAVHFILPCFLHPMSAGTGENSFGDEFEDLTLIKRPPKGTTYAARVKGESMEPTYHDGDLLFVSGIPEIRQGQTGVFFMDGQQWVKELGDGVLISHNPGYDPIPMRSDIRCQGLVLGICDASYFA